MKTQAMKKRMREQMKVCSDAFTLPIQAWPDGTIPAALTERKCNSPMASIVRHRASSELDAVGQRLIEWPELAVWGAWQCQALSARITLCSRHQQCCRRRAIDVCMLRCNTHADDQRAKAEGKFELDFSGLKRAKTAVRGAKEREALDADFKTEIEQREKALSKAAPNLKALQQFEAVKVGTAALRGRNQSSKAKRAVLESFN